MDLSSNLRGALFMCISMAVFSMNDAITKTMSESMNMGQVMAVRGLFAAPLVALLAWRRAAMAPLRTALHPMVVLRVLGEAGGTICYLLALSRLPIGTVSAVMQALPLAVTMGAALVFAEPVGWRRWMAITLGFVGVMVIVRPGLDGFSPSALFVLLAVGCCAVRDLATTRIPAEIPTLFVSTVTAAFILLVGVAIVSPFGGWTPMGTGHAAMLFLAAVLVVIGYQFIIQALREGEISMIAPFRYTALLWSMTLGFVFFAEIPDNPMIAGATLIVASGLYAIYRESRRGNDRPAAESTGPAMAPDGT